MRQVTQRGNDDEGAESLAQSSSERFEVITVLRSW
jgi:hypothetical protein